MFHQVRKYLLLIKSDADPKYGSCCVSVCLDVCLGVSGCVWVCLGVSRCLGIWVAISVDADPPTRPPTSRPSLAFTHTLSLPRSLALSLSFAISRHTLALFRYLPSHPLARSLSLFFSLALLLSRSRSSVPMSRKPTGTGSPTCCCWSTTPTSACLASATTSRRAGSW